MTNISIKFGVSISTHYKERKGDEKCRKWGSLVWGRHESLKVIGNSTI